MSGNLLRRVAITSATALLIGSLAAAPASAIVPPTEGPSTCDSVADGYTVAASGNAADWAFDGRLRWDLCVTRNANGTVTGWVRLSAPSEAITGFKHDRFTGLVEIYLQRCVTRGVQTIAQGSWHVSGHQLGNLVGGWYRFGWHSTASVASSGTSFRVRTKSFGAVVQNSGWYYSLSASEYPGFDDEGQPIYGISKSDCFSL